MIIRCKEKTRNLLFMMGIISDRESNKCSVRRYKSGACSFPIIISIGQMSRTNAYVVNFNGSLDRAQLNSFGRQIGDSLGINVYHYCMVLFSHNNDEGLFCHFLIVISFSLLNQFFILMHNNDEQ